MLLPSADGSERPTTHLDRRAARRRVQPDGRRVAGHIAVGQPYAIGGGDPGGSHEAHGPVEIDGLHPHEQTVIGGGSLHALVLAVDLLGSKLRDFTARGGRVLDPTDDSDVSLTALFGPMLRPIGLPEAG